ncbi:hypothetical protein [Nocardiopsis alba]|uniref:hypothetical protein n=1 Tax=Nocardiopsis alba TaxID=53437 RepID=UPI0035DFF840
MSSPLSLPASLIAVRVILFVRATLGALLHLSGLFAVVFADDRVFQDDYGMMKGPYLVLLLVGLSLVALEGGTAIAFGRGGHGIRALVRVAVGAGLFLLVTRPLFVEFDRSVLLGLVLVLLVLILNESASAKEWYDDTECPNAAGPSRGR